MVIGVLVNNNIKGLVIDFKGYKSTDKELVEQYIKWVKYELAQVGDGNKLDYEKGLDICSLYLK